MNAGNFGVMQFLLQQGLFALPSLLIFAIALVLALSNLTKAPRPAWFTLIGSSLLLVANLLLLVARAYLFANQSSGGMHLVHVMQILGFVDVSVDFFGMLMIVSAIFLDRTPVGGPGVPYSSATASQFPPPPRV